MTNKRFWLGMLVKLPLVVVLVFGMTVVGCEEEEYSPSEHLEVTIIVTDIPFSKMNNQVTVSLIKDGNAFISNTGKVTAIFDSDGNLTNSCRAEIRLVRDSFDSSKGREQNAYGDWFYPVHVGLKVGIDPPLTSTSLIKLRISSSMEGPNDSWVDVVRDSARCSYNDFQ
jgi:hypothetical protein